MKTQTALAWTTLALAVSACGSRDLKIDIPPTYSSIQRIVISTKCLQCHESLATYDGLLKIVTPGDPDHSRLYELVSEGEMPRQSPKLSDKEISAIRAWISNGAPND